MPRTPRPFTHDLGTGLHFGEWWGKGIQRSYGSAQRFFSLFNTARYGALSFSTPNLAVVPVMYEGPFNETEISTCLAWLKAYGSLAMPFPNPEGIVVFHTAANQMFKVTLEGDESPKSLVAA